MVYAVQYNSVAVPSQDELRELQQGGIQYKNDGNDALATHVCCGIVSVEPYLL